MNLIDSHCHLDRLEFNHPDENLQTVLAQARDRHIGGFLCVDIDLDNFADVKRIAESAPDIWCSAGVHPLADLNPEQLDSVRLKSMAKSSAKVVAIGECGLDYYYKKDRQAQQRAVFEKQLAVAMELELPVIVHTRDAREDTLALLDKYTSQGLKGVLHCFTESMDMALAALEMGFYISFSGIITFRNASSLRDVVQAVPLDRLLVETDSPYLAPVPHRGKSNRPTWVLEVAEKVAEVKGLDLAEVANQTTRNFHHLFPTEYTGTSASEVQ